LAPSCEVALSLAIAHPILNQDGVE
jgi:hypothetical protein